MRNYICVQLRDEMLMHGQPGGRHPPKLLHFEDSDPKDVARARMALAGLLKEARRLGLVLVSAHVYKRCNGLSLPEVGEEA